MKYKTKKLIEHKVQELLKGMFFVPQLCAVLCIVCIATAIVGYGSVYLFHFFAYITFVPLEPPWVFIPFLMVLAVWSGVLSMLGVK